MTPELLGYKSSAKASAKAKAAVKAKASPKQVVDTGPAVSAPVATAQVAEAEVLSKLSEKELLTKSSSSGPLELQQRHRNSNSYGLRVRHGPQIFAFGVGANRQVNTEQLEIWS